MALQSSQPSAQRSAEAAQRAKVQISESLERVGRGAELVNRSGEALQQIEPSVRKVATLKAEILAATDDQSIDIEQVSKAVQDMDTMTQQNAALVEQFTAACRSMEEKAADL